jgi:hypothetical protein
LCSLSAKQRREGQHSPLQSLSNFHISVDLSTRAVWTVSISAWRSGQKTMKPAASMTCTDIRPVLGELRHPKPGPSTSDMTCTPLGSFSAKLGNGQLWMGQVLENEQKHCRHYCSKRCHPTLDADGSSWAQVATQWSGAQNGNWLLSGNEKLSQWKLQKRLEADRAKHCEAHGESLHIPGKEAAPQMIEVDL